MKKLFTVAVVSTAMLLAACGGAKEEAPAGGEEKVATSEPTAATGATGVAECDDMYAKIEACLKDKVPEAQRAGMEAGFKQSKDAMSKVTDKAQLAQMCKTQMEQSKASYAAMGCTL